MIGAISDTHGLLRPEAVTALRGVTQIVHAGDIGDPAVIDQLALLAPVTAVRGNNDRDAWARQFPASALLVLGSQRILVLHEIADLEQAIAMHAVQPDVVVTGHSHKASINERDGVLFVNPGSAGPRRFKLPVTLATLELRRGLVHAQIRELQIG